MFYTHASLSTCEGSESPVAPSIASRSLILGETVTDVEIFFGVQMDSISVRNVLAKANMLLRADKRSSTMVNSVTDALESDGVTFAWQLLHLQAWYVSLPYRSHT